MVTKFKKNLIEVFNDYIIDYGIEGLFEELFPNQDPAEVFADIYDQGLIPTDLIERFLDDE